MKLEREREGWICKYVSGWGIVHTPIQEEEEEEGEVVVVQEVVVVVVVMVEKDCFSRVANGNGEVQVSAATAT